MNTNTEQILFSFNIERHEARKTYRGSLIVKDTDGSEIDRFVSREYKQKDDCRKEMEDLIKFLQDEMQMKLFH